MLSKYTSFLSCILWGHLTLQEVHLKLCKSRKGQPPSLNVTVCKLGLWSICMSMSACPLYYINSALFLCCDLHCLWCLVVPDTASLNVYGFVLRVLLNKILKVLGAVSQNLSTLTSQESALISTGLSPVSPSIISDGTHVSCISTNAFSGLPGEDIHWWRRCSQQGSSVQVHF